MKKRIESLLLPNLQTSRENLWSTNSCLSGDTRIYPLVQMGPFGITLDELVTKALFEKAASNVCIYLASGYFNLTDHYMDSIINICKARFEIFNCSTSGIIKYLFFNNFKLH